MHPLPHHLPKPLQAGHKISDKYTLGEEIGKGGFGTVYECQNTKTGETVAAKRISIRNLTDEQLHLLEEEISLLKKLNHPNIVKYIGTVRTRNHLHILLEYMENGSLTQNIKKFGVFAPELVALFTRQILQGLVYLHEQGVIHRDIKGANILTTKSGRVKLADFGVATYVVKTAHVRKNTRGDLNDEASSVISNGTESQTDASISNNNAENNRDLVVGTPYWMAPEIIEMSGATTACDVWSVGCTVVELLTGKPPYFEVPPMAALYRIVADEVVPLPTNLDAPTLDFLKKCFTKSPLLRATAQELLEHPWIAQTRRHENIANSTSPTSAQQIQLQLQQELLVDNPPDNLDDVQPGNDDQHSYASPPPPGKNVKWPSIPNNEQGLKKSSIASGTAPPPPPPVSTKDSVTAKNNDSTSSQQLQKQKLQEQPEQQSLQNADEGMKHVSMNSITSDGRKASQNPNGSSSSLNLNNRGPRHSLPGEVYDTVNVSYPEISEADRRSWRAGSIAQKLESARKAMLAVTESSDEAEDWDKEFGFQMEEGPDSNLGLGRAYTGPSRAMNNLGGNDDKSSSSESVGNQAHIRAVQGSGIGVRKPIRSEILTSVSIPQRNNPLGGRNMVSAGTAGVAISRGRIASGRSSQGLNIMSPVVEVPTLALGRIEELDLDSVFQGDVPYGERSPAQTSGKGGRLVSHHLENSSSRSVLTNIDTADNYNPSGSVMTTTAGNSNNTNNNGALARYRESEVDADFRKITLDDRSKSPIRQLNPDGTSQIPTVGSKRNSVTASDDDDHESVAMELRKRLSKLPNNVGPNTSGKMDDAFLVDTVSSSIRAQNSNDEDLPRKAAEVQILIGKLRPVENTEENIVSSCANLLEMFDEQPKLRRTLLTHQGVIPIMEALESNSMNQRTTQAVLRVVAKIISGDRQLQEVMAIAGIIPIIARHASASASIGTRLQAAEIVKNYVETSGETLQVFVACGGLPVLTKLLEPCLEHRSSAENPLSSNSHQNNHSRMNSKNEIPYTPGPDVLLSLVALSGIRRVFRLSDALFALPPLTMKAKKTSNPNASDGVASKKGSSSSSTTPATTNANNNNNYASLGSGSKNNTDKTDSSSFKATDPQIDSSTIFGRSSIGTIPRNDFCRIFIRTGLLDLIAQFLDFIRTKRGESDCVDAGVPVARLLGDTASVLLVFSLGNSFVKQRLASPSVIRSILSALSDLWARARESPTGTKADAEADVAKILLKTVKNLCIEPTTLDVLESAGAISTLVPFLIFSIGGHAHNLSGAALLDLEQRIGFVNKSSSTSMKKDFPTSAKKGSLDPSKPPSKKDKSTAKRSPAALSGSSGQEIHNMVILSMYYLTRLNPSRQEQAVAAGIVPFLKETILGPSPVKTFALQMLCDTAHTSAFTRHLLWREGVVDFFLELLVCNDVFWEEKVLGALQVWLQHATSDVERAFLRPIALLRFVGMFQTAQSNHFEYVSKVLLEMLESSPKLAEAIGRSGFFMAELAARLSYPKPEVRIDLLKLLKVIGEHYSDLENLVLEHNLYAIVQSISKDKTRVVVAEVAHQVLEQWKPYVDLA